MNSRGRPLGSEVRQNIIELLSIIGPAHGYDIWKDYIKIFPKVTQRLIYYHLHKGLETEEFKIAEIKVETGNYTWGPQAEKKYYAIGNNALPQHTQEWRKETQSKLKGKNNE